MTSYRVLLRFRAGGPAVTGDWDKEETARSCYRAFVGRYSGHPEVTILLIENPETDGHRVRERWPPLG